MDSDNNASDSEANSNPTSPASTGGTSSPVATRSNRTANTSDNDSIKSESADSSPEQQVRPQSPMPEEEVEDGPQSPGSSRSNSPASRGAPESPQGPESPPGEPADEPEPPRPPPPPPPPAASTNGGGDPAATLSDGEDGSVSSSNSSDGRKPSSPSVGRRSRSSSRGSRQVRRQANLDDGITTSEEETDSDAESSRSSAGSHVESAKDPYDKTADRNRRLRSPPPQRPSVDVRPEAISDGDMESDDSESSKPPSPKPLPKDSPPPSPKEPTKSFEPTPATTSTQPPAKDLNLTHDDLSDVSDLDDDDSIGRANSDQDNDKKADSESDGEIDKEETEPRSKAKESKHDDDDDDEDEDGILSPVNEQDKGVKGDKMSPLKGKDASDKNKKSAEPNTTPNKPPQQQHISPVVLPKPQHSRITHDNKNGDENDEEQLDFEAEDGEQQDQEESCDATNKDNNVNINSSIDTNSPLNLKEKEPSTAKQDNDKSPKQKAALLPTPAPTDQSSKHTSSDQTKQKQPSLDGNSDSTTQSNGKVQITVKEPVELEEGEVSDEDEARPEETEPRPVCRFFSRGQCTWGASCRFLHPGVTDKGHYTMFEVVRPTLLSEYGSALSNSGRPPSLLEDPRIGLPPGHQASQPPIESAWERGLRTAKEMLRKSIKRKEQDMDFEEKKMNLTLAQHQQDEEEDAGLVALGRGDVENGGGYYASSSARATAPAIPPLIHERELPTSSRHRTTSSDLRDQREVDAIYGREHRHMDRLDAHQQRHLDRLERMAAAEAGHRGSVMAEREHRRTRGDEGITAEEYYQHQARAGGRFQMAGGQIVPAHHLIYQEEYSSGSSQRAPMHPQPSNRSYSRHPADIPQHHPASHLPPASYREHRPEYYHEQRTREAKYMHAASPLDGAESVLVAEAHREGREGRSARGASGRSREVIVQRAEVIEQQQQQQQQQQVLQLHRERGMEGYRMGAGGRHPAAGMMQMVGARPDEWADPWMRSKSPGGGRTGARVSKTGKKRSYTSASSYSSSSNSSSRSRSSSRSSTRSSLRSRSRSPHAAGVHGRGTLVPPRHGGGRGGRGGVRQAVSPSVIVSERKAANERAAAMNPPAPKRSNKASSPSMMRAGAQNPPAPHQPTHHSTHSHTSSQSSSSNRNKLVLAAAALAARKQHQRVAAVAAAVAATGAARRRSSSGSSSGSSSDSDSSSGSSSGSGSGASGSSGGSRGRRSHVRRSAQSSGTSNPPSQQQRELALGLALKQAKAIDALNKTSAAQPAQEKRSQIKLNLKAPANAGSAGGGKKRPAPPSSPPGDGGKKSKGSSSRREELLKQLKAVEDAIAKKRSKV